MVLRFLFRWLANNEQLVARLSESYPIRRAAQGVVYLINKSKFLSENSNWSSKLKELRDKLEKEARK